MKYTLIFAIFTLIMIVKGNLIAAVAWPVILSIGTIFTALKTQDAMSGIQLFEKEEKEEKKEKKEREPVVWHAPD